MPSGEVIKQPILGRRLIKVGVVAGALLATTLFLPNEVSEPEMRVEPLVDAVVVEIDPIALDCRTRNTTEFEDSTASINYVLAPKALGRSLFSLDLARDRRVSLRGNTAEEPGVAETLSCVSGESTIINDNNPDSVKVAINSQDITFETKLVEDEVRSYRSQDNIGELLDDLPASLLSGVGVERLKNRLEEIDGMLDQAARINAVNSVQEDCQEAAWPITQQAIRVAYLQQAESRADLVGAKPPDVSVNFIGKPDFARPYDLPNGFEEADNYDLKFRQEADECLVAPGALTQNYSMLHDK